ncbi:MULTISPECIES: hypothetical protein [Mycobacteriaceae]|uniref:hypothetical protein n=1 Tax=Mycobacteriaceae TaxID=1762 RepID=UPI000AB4E57F|nr:MULTISPECIES: hypothetical protein [Mycolicibacterium]
MSESTGSQGVPNPTHDAATSDATKPAADAPPASAPGTATAAANTPAAATNTTSTTNAAKPAAPAPSTAGAAKPAGKLTATGTVKGAGGLYKAQYSRGVDVLDKGIEKLGAKGMAKSALKIGARAVPGIGTVVGLGFAAQDLKDGDVVGALLNTIGAIPGPIGWIGLGAGQAWEAFGPDWHLWGNGGAGYGLWDAPDGTSTHMLPAAASEAAGVREVDAALATVQRNIFGFEDGPNGSVWNSNPPAALTLDTPQVEAAVKTWLTGIADLFHQMDQTMAQSGEPYFEQYRQKLAPHFSAIAALPDKVPEVMAQLRAGSKAAESAYDALLAANRNARNQLTDHGALTDQSPATTLKNTLETELTKVQAAADKLATVFDGPIPAPVQARSATASPHDKTATTPVTAHPSPLAPTPPSPTSPSVKDTGTSDKSDLGNLLSKLGQTPPAGSMGTPMGAPSTGSGGGGTPLNSPASSKPDSEPKKLLDDDKDHKKREDRKPEPLTAVKSDTAKPASTAPVTAGTAPAAPVTGVPPTAKPAVAPEQSREVQVKDRKVTFPDAKSAKLAQVLAAADPTHPVSLADAAAQAGLKPPVPGQDLGQQVAPVDAKPGDILDTGDKKFMLLGDGAFYDLSEYKVVDASALPQDMGERAAYFHLEDAGAASSPVSGQAPAATTFDVPGGTPEPHVPADGSPASPAAPAGAPADPAVAPESGTQAIPSVGTPGVPRQGEGGPANAAATDTGTGTDVPSSTAPRLDPGAVK